LLPAAFAAFIPAYIVFVFVGLAIFVWAAVRAGSPGWIFAFPPIAMLVHVGQPTLLIGSFLLLGFLLRDWRLRGLLFGLAAAIKPQLCLFVPLALVLDRDWRTILLSAVVVLMLAGAATLTFGSSVWQDWLNAMQSLRALVLSSPSLSANMLHTNPVIFVVPAMLLVWFTRDANASIRLASTTGAALLVSPYAMSYELALLAPAVAWATRINPWMLIASLVLGLAFFVFELAVLVAVLLALVWIARFHMPAPSERDDRGSL
jgi:hypothetical protein